MVLLQTRKGGDGVASTITGSSVTRASGGCGGSYYGDTRTSSGGGGAGQIGTDTDGVANTGGGGGGYDNLRWMCIWCWCRWLSR